MLSLNQVLEKSSLDVAKWCIEDFMQVIDINCNSTSDMTKISEKMLELTNKYAYIQGLLAYIKVLIRESKCEGNKSKADSLIDKKDALERSCESLKLQHLTLSRMITAKQEELRELYMTGCK